MIFEKLDVGTDGDCKVCDSFKRNVLSTNLTYLIFSLNRVDPNFVVKPSQIVMNDSPYLMEQMERICRLKFLKYAVAKLPEFMNLTIAECKRYRG